MVVNGKKIEIFIIRKKGSVFFWTGNIRMLRKKNKKNVVNNLIKDKIVSYL